jgi:hypothetical protein
MEERRVFCDICNKRLDEIRKDGIIYYEITPIEGVSTHNAHLTAPLPPEVYIDLYGIKHICIDCYRPPSKKGNIQK